MTRVLVLNSAATGERSVSNRLTGELVDQLRRHDPALAVTTRDLGADPVPHLTAQTVGAIRGVAGTEAGHIAQALSDQLIAELRAADLIVIGAPMYNFGIPSTLKAWFDHVLRSGETFRYTADGPEGLLKSKRAIVVETRGGLYSEGPAAAMDSQEPHLRTMLGFMGVTDVTFIRAERLALGDATAATAIADALRDIEELAAAELPLAA